MAAPRRRPAQIKASDQTAAMASAGSESNRTTPVRYRGFVLIPQADLTWVVRPERSPLELTPFRAPASSVQDVKALVDWRLNKSA